MNLHFYSMRVKVVILVSGIFIANVLAYSDEDFQIKSHTDDYDITTIYNIEQKFAENEGNTFNGSICLECTDVEIHLRTNAIGMPIHYNGTIISSPKKSLEFIADKKYPNNIFTKNNVEYVAKEWRIESFPMTNMDKLFFYDLLLWNYNNREESFKIEWTQKTTTKTCISVSYILKDVSKCELSMVITNQNNLSELYSYDFQQAPVLSTIVLKRSETLLKNITYSLHLKIKKSPNGLFHDDFSYYSRKHKSIFHTNDCRFGIKQISQCEDEYGSEEVFTLNGKQLRNVPSALPIFNVYPIDFTTSGLSFSQNTSSTKCHNGGFFYNDKCTCPPGFKGDKCDFACGPNTFGVDCTGMCSMHTNQCQGMIFCTNNFGCSCATGYHGEYCNKECTRGTYGVNCQQKCSEKCNTGKCDIYTGACTDGCTKSYIPPNCLEKYPWLNKPPQIKSISNHNIELKLSFDVEDINGSKQINSTYYQIAYKPALSESKFEYTEIKEIGLENSVEEVIDNLKQGTLYSFGVMIISEDGNYNDEDIKIVNISTTCQMPENIDYDVRLLSDANNINVTWNNKLDIQNEDVCEITKYVITIMLNKKNLQQKSYSEEVQTDSENNEYRFENLLSGNHYAIKVTAVTTAGQADSSKVYYISTKLFGLINISNITTKLHDNQSSLLITWDVDKEYEEPITYIVKYKANKYFSCSPNVVTSNWTSILVYNETKLAIRDLIPNTQYVLKIETTDERYIYNEYENMFFIKTPASMPNLTPYFEENGSYITNETAHFSWKIDMNECRKINGFIRGYHLIIKNIDEGTLSTENNTKKNLVTINGLKPETNYELQVYISTNFGFNPDQALLIPFKTKSKYLEAVEELIVYKKNLKNKSMGVRWSFPDTYNVNGFIVTIEGQKNFTIHMTVEPEKCVAWPKYYCTTIENLIPNNEYKIKVKAKSLDYPAGGSQASVTSNFNDGFSEKPANLRATQISSNNITLEWDIPWVFNGVLKSFIVNTEEMSSIDVDKCCETKPDFEVLVTEEKPSYNCTIHDLKPGSTYSISVLPKKFPYGQTNRIYVTVPDVITTSPAYSENTLNTSTFILDV